MIQEANKENKIRYNKNTSLCKNNLFNLKVNSLKCKSNMKS